MPENSDFFRERQEAIERMREMSRKSNFGIPAPPFVEPRGNNKARHKPTPPPPPRKPEEEHKKQEGFLNDILSGLNLPFLNGEDSSDISVLLALLLLLLDKGEDKLLLYALIYILL